MAKTGTFNEFLSTQNVNVANFTRNVEWDFFCDYQTPSYCLNSKMYLHLCESGIDAENVVFVPQNPRILSSQNPVDFASEWEFAIDMNFPWDLVSLQEEKEKDFFRRYSSDYWKSLLTRTWWTAWVQNGAIVKFRSPISASIWRLREPRSPDKAAFNFWICFSCTSWSYWIEITPRLDPFLRKVLSTKNY